MTYDIHGPWDKRVGHNAPLTARASASREEQQRTVVGREHKCSAMFSHLSFKMLNVRNQVGVGVGWGGGASGLLFTGGPESHHYLA